MALTASGLVAPYGAIAFGDVHTLLGSQQQPPFAWVDHMGGTFLDSLKSTTNAKFDRVMGLAHAAMVFVPFHQTLISGGSVVDGGVYSTARTDLPVVNWALSASAGSPLIQAFRDRTFANEYMSVHLDGSKNYTTDVAAMSAEFTATTWNPPGGASTAMSEQGFTMFFQRTRFGTVAAAAAADIEISWTISGEVFKAVLSTAKTVKVFRGSEEVRSAVTSPNPLGLTGGAPMQDLGGNLWIQVQVVGGRLSVNAPNMGLPIIVNLNRLWRADVDSAPSSTTPQMVEGSAVRFPAPSFAAKAWPSGQFPTAASRKSITVTARSGDLLSVSGATILETDQIAVVEPKITSVGIKFTKFTQASFSLHLARWSPTFEYDSVQQGMGITPDPSTPFVFDVSLSGETKIGLASGASFTPMDFSTHSITVTDVTSGQLAQYTLQCASSGSGDFSYGGQTTTRYTPAVERVCSRMDGIVEDVDESAVVSTVFNLVPDDLNRHLAGFSEVLEFDIANLRVRQQMSLDLFNWEGIASLSAITGVAGAGNVAALMRWGWQHQVGISGGEGDAWTGGGVGPGWARMWGYCDTYTYTSQQGRHMMRMSVKSMMDRLDEAIIVCPPNIDGWNHFWAVKWILNYCGIPDNRIGFLPMCPAAPDLVAAGDPDGPNGYFLPIGVGSQPWTPIDRRISASQLLATIQSVTGYVLYADAYGVMQYESFLRAGTATPKRVFRERYPYDTKHGLTTMWGLSTTISTADTRNVVAVVGMDIFNPAGSRLDTTDYRKVDEASISSLPGAQPANYVGWRKIFAMLDTRFASAALTRSAAERQFAIMRLPQIVCSFTCWGQPDLYPMDQIAVEDWRSGLTAYPATEADWLVLTITRMSTRLESLNGAIMPVSQITAQYIPLEAAGEVGDSVPVASES